MFKKYLNICGIYCLRNKINNKTYIGLSRNIGARLYVHNYDSKTKNTHLYNSLRKYGWENFDIILLEECEENELNTKEKYYIQYFKSFDSKYGYNKTLGGESYLLTVEQRQNFIFIKTILEGKKIISVNIESGELEKFDSLRGYCRKNSKDQSTILDALNKRRPTAYGKVWFYESEYPEDFNLKDFMKSSKKSKKVRQFALDDTFIKEYSSASDASKNGFDASAIIKCCNGKYRHHHNYIWKYSIDCEEIIIK